MPARVFPALHYQGVDGEQAGAGAFVNLDFNLHTPTMFSLFPPLLVVVEGLLLVVVGVLWLRARAQLKTALEPRLTRSTKGAEQSAVRRLRLVSQDLRNIGMTLHGNAGDLEDRDSPNAGGIATVATEVFEMADDLNEFTLQENTVRVMKEEEIDLGLALNDAIQVVQTSLGPGRREWRISPEAAATQLNADRRALRHIFNRALTTVVRASRNDGVIEIGVRTKGDEFRMVIGSNLADPVASTDHPTPSYDSRGVSLKVTLAQSLMVMQGGRLEVDTQKQGMQISLIFPVKRVLSSPVMAQGVPVASDVAMAPIQV